MAQEGEGNSQPGCSSEMGLQVRRPGPGPGHREVVMWLLEVDAVSLGDLGLLSPQSSFQPIPSPSGWLAQKLSCCDRACVRVCAQKMRM